MLSTQIFLLSIIQGITEFLPISSSGHLVLVPLISDLPDQGPLIDVAVHVGSLGAVILYFWRDVGALFRGAAHIVSGRMKSPDARLLLLLILSTIPLVIGGFIVYKLGLLDHMRSIQVIAWTTIGYGILLYLSDRFGATDRHVTDMDAKKAVLIGLAQVLAVVPGTSRSGITMTAARALGFERREAARFAMLMSIPAISAAGLLASLDIFGSNDVALQSDALMAAGFSFLTAYASIALFMRWINRIGMGPFALYRLALGAALLLLF